MAARTPAKKTPSKGAKSEGFPPIFLLFAFLLGFILWPLYQFLSYEIHWKEDGSILMVPLETAPVVQEVTPVPTPVPVVASSNRVTRPAEKSEALPVVTPAQPQTVLSEVKEEDPSARARWLVKKAVMDYNQRFSQMKELNLFELIGKGFLKEIPNCPNNGIFHLSYEGNLPIVDCRRR